jgi:hypothetical protein
MQQISRKPGAKALDGRSIARPEFKVLIRHSICNHIATAWEAQMKRLGLTGRKLVINLFILLFAAPSYGQDDFAYMRDNFMKVAVNYRSVVLPYLNSRERAIIGDIQFEFQPINILNAAAYRQNGTRKIVMANGWLWLAHQISLAESVTEQSNARGCLVGYMLAVADTLVDNPRRDAAGLPLHSTPSFAKFLETDQAGICKGIGLEEISNPDVLKMVAARMNCSVAWVIGHEIAHHVLGHVDQKKVPSLAQSRQIESDADLWSVQRAFDIKLNPILADRVLLLYSMIGAADHQSELLSTHPASIRRYSKFLSAIEEKMRDKDWYRQKFGYTPPAEMLDGIERERALAASLIP